MPSTAACFSRSAQICRNVSSSAQMPSHCGHSCRLLPPITTAFIPTLQRGHISWAASATSCRSAFAPQCEQNFAPANISPKQDGHATVANRAPQCSHCVASLAAGAPHIGQFNVSAESTILLITPLPPPRQGQSPPTPFLLIG